MKNLEMMGEVDEEQVGEHGGDRRSGTGKKEFGNEYNAKDIKDGNKVRKRTIW